MMALSTITQVRDAEILKNGIKRAVDTAANEMFEDGMNSDFSRAVTQHVMEYGDVAVDLWIEYIITEGNINETGDELPRVLGNIDDPNTEKSRFDALISLLRHDDPRVRDATGLGLSFMENPNCLHALYVAHNQESIHWVKTGLKQIIKQFE